MTRFWIGALLFVAGGALWLRTRRAADTHETTGHGVLPPLLPRFGLALAALGAATMSSTQPELSWMVSTICFAAVSIILMVSILVEQLRGPASRRND